MSELSRLSPAECSKGMFRVSFQAMGTACEVAYSSPTAREAELFRREVMAWVDGFEKRYSRYLPDSLVGRVNAAAGRESVEVNEEDLHLLDLCDGLHFLTEGLFDPTTLPLSLLWDFKARDPQVPDEGRIASALRLVGWKKVVREGNRIFLPEEGMGLDFGGFGKEYAVDRALEMAMARGIEDVLVNFGGDVRVLGSPPDATAWRVGVEDPNRPGEPGLLLALDDGAVATSGNYRRFFERAGRRYGHLLDHRTGYPTSSECLSATVVAGTCLEAGVLATCSLLEGPRKGLASIERFFGAEGCVRTESGLKWSKGFDGQVVEK